MTVFIKHEFSPTAEEIHARALLMPHLDNVQVTGPWKQERDWVPRILGYRIVDGQIGFAIPVLQATVLPAHRNINIYVGMEPVRGPRTWFRRRWVACARQFIEDGHDAEQYFTNLQFKHPQKLYEWLWWCRYDINKTEGDLTDEHLRSPCVD